MEDHRIEIPRTEFHAEIDRLVAEIDETNAIAGFLNRSKKLLKNAFIEGIFYGIGGAITVMLVKKYFPKGLSLT